MIAGHLVICIVRLSTETDRERRKEKKDERREKEGGGKIDWADQSKHVRGQLEEVAASVLTNLRIGVQRGDQLERVHSCALHRKRANISVI